MILKVTRAKSGLIVIGDSRTLKNEIHWKAFVDWCRAEGCYISSPLKPEVLARLYSSARPAAPYIAPIMRDDGGRHIDRMKQERGEGGAIEVNKGEGEGEGDKEEEEEEEDEDDENGQDEENADNDVFRFG